MLLDPERSTQGGAPPVPNPDAQVRARCDVLAAVDAARVHVQLHRHVRPHQPSGVVHDFVAEQVEVADPGPDAVVSPRGPATMELREYALPEAAADLAFPPYAETMTRIGRE